MIFAACPPAHVVSDAGKRLVPMGELYRLDTIGANDEIGAVSDLARQADNRRTFWGLAGDFFFFGVGASFASQTTVIPSFLATLTTSAPLIGLASTLLTGGWLLPQLFAANRLAGLTHRKAAVVVPAIIGRSIALIIPPAIIILAPRSPGALLAAFFVLYFAFYLVDGVASVAWLDILGRCLPAQARARLISLGTTAPGLAGIGAGALIGIILSSSRIPWPFNYALLFGLCAICWALSLISFLFIREVPPAVVRKPLAWGLYFRRLATVVKADPAFRRAVGLWIALGGVGIAAPFYVIHGLQALGFPPASVGFFTSVQLVGGVFSALLLGVMGERRGTRSVMRLWGCLALAAPVIATAAPLIGRAAPEAVIYVYAGVFIVVGMQGNANMAGFLNWVLEWAPESDRPLYIGFANTLTGISLVMPLIGGWILQSTGSYPALFIAALAGPVVALFLLRRLPEPRRNPPAYRDGAP
jgi:MFS family permease